MENKIGKLCQYADRVWNISGENAKEKAEFGIKKMEEFIRRYKAGVKSKQARGREKILNRMEKMENPVVTTQKIKLKFDIKAQSVDLVLDIKNLSKTFEDKLLFIFSLPIVYLY